MAQITPGELDKFYYIAESVYGTTPTDALTWGCDIRSLKPKINAHKEYHLLGGSRSHGAVTKGAWEVGFLLKGLAHTTSGSYDWHDFWAVYGLGSASGVTEHLGSFTAQVSKTIGGSSLYDFYNGCKINRLTLRSAGPGQLIEFEAEVFCRWLTQDTDKDITGLQGLTVGANATNITSNVLTWAEALQINIAGGGLADWHPRQWELVVDNHLERHLGNIEGADTNDYACTYALSEGERDIILTVDVPYEDETYTAAKLASSVITSATIPVDDETITLATGELAVDGDDWPEYKPALMDEPVRMRFQGLTIA